MVMSTVHPLKKAKGSTGDALMSRERSQCDAGQRCVIRHVHELYPPCMTLHGVVCGGVLS